MTPGPDAVIIGAGPAGLACAVAMRAAGLNVWVLEKADCVGAVWRRHYDRLHLHTDRNHSGLPGMAIYFCGQITVPTGQLREIGIEAPRIADSANAYVGRAA